MLVVVACDVNRRVMRPLDAEIGFAVQAPHHGGRSRSVRFNITLAVWTGDHYPHFSALSMCNLVHARTGPSAHSCNKPSAADDSPRLHSRPRRFRRHCTLWPARPFIDRVPVDKRPQSHNHLGLAVRQGTKSPFTELGITDPDETHGVRSTLRLFARQTEAIVGLDVDFCQPH